MDTSLLVTLARQMSARDRMSVIADNIANMSTTAYKGERLMFGNYLAPTRTGKQISFPQNGGIYRDSRDGTITTTSAPLDLALRGDGYFTIRTAKGFRYTRNGHFTLDSTGRMVTTRGEPVMNTADRPITFAPGDKDITIAEDGTISVDGQRRGRLKLVAFPAGQQLQRLGGGMFASMQPPTPAVGAKVLQGRLEESNVEPILELTRFMKIVRGYEITQKLMEREGERQQRAIDKLGSLPS